MNHKNSTAFAVNIAFFTDQKTENGIMELFDMFRIKQTRHENEATNTCPSSQSSKSRYVLIPFSVPTGIFELLDVQFSSGSILSVI